LWVTGWIFVDLAKTAKHAKNTTRKTPVTLLVWKKTAGFILLPKSRSSPWYTLLGVLGGLGESKKQG
jgi:hypothetical protein